MLNAVMPMKDKLFRYAYRILGNQMAAEDVVQEVFVKVWKKGKELELVENMEAWSMRVTRNLALDKKRKTIIHHESVEGHFALADDASTPYERLQSKELAQTIRDAISALPEDQRQVVHLRDIEGYTYKEIAEITGFTLEKVKVYLHRARMNLRKKLQNLKI